MTPLSSGRRAPMPWRSCLTTSSTPSRRCADRRHRFVLGSDRGVAMLSGDRRVGRRHDGSG
jgi:hypothetical protein